MKNYILTFFIILVVSKGFSQTIDLKIENSKLYPNSYYEENISKEFIRNESNDFNEVSNSNLVLIICIDKSKILKLEGMSNIYTGTGKIKFLLRNSVLDKDSLWVFNSEIKVKNEADINEKLISNFKNNKLGYKNLSEFIKSFSTNTINANCQSIINNAQKDVELKLWQDAIFKLKGVSKSKCKTEVDKILLIIEEKQDKEFCDEKLPKIKILAYSGIAYKMEKAIDELYNSPSKSKCKEDVFLIAKYIGNYFSKLPESENKVKQINNFISNYND